MKLTVAICLLSFIALVWGESCVVKYDCIDVGCNHHTMNSCENHICTCSPITDKFRCATAGDCQRHTGICNTKWLCLNRECRCQ
uniref:Uncharacterized protein n=1 Tax=Pinctada fucata TaxID=50426 RepID=A0A194ANN4_PINFU